MPRHSSNPKDNPHSGGPNGQHGPKPKRSEMTVRTSGGAIIWKATAKLFGLGKGKNK